MFEYLSRDDTMNHLKCVVVNNDDIDRPMKFNLQLIIHDDNVDDEDICLIDGLGLPWWFCGKESARQYRRHEFSL